MKSTNASQLLVVCFVAFSLDHLVNAAIPKQLTAAQHGISRFACSSDFRQQYLVAGERLNEALAGAQRELIVNRDTAHPFFWAGFLLLGEGGGPP